MSTDLRSCPEWTSLDLWLCDIEERKGEPDNDFLFLAKISCDGDCHKTDGTGRCIFQDVMYDIQSFQEDTVYDGSLDFAIKFGRNTKERPEVPQGWTVQFKKLIKDPKKDEYAGKILTSWWGERDVKIINYASLTDAQKKQYPDLVARYYRSQ